MRLTERYRPGTLGDVVGQPPVRLLKALVQNPYACCVLFEGPPGVGKTTAALRSLVTWAASMSSAG